jgi:hypothetical protein
MLVATEINNEILFASKVHFLTNTDATTSSCELHSVDISQRYISFFTIQI